MVLSHFLKCELYLQSTINLSPEPRTTIGTTVRTIQQKETKNRKQKKKMKKKKTAEILALCKIVDQEVISIERQTQIASLWAGMASFWASTVSQKNFSKMK